MGELGVAHGEAFSLRVSAQCALTDRLVALGAAPWGIGTRHPTVALGMPWFVGPFHGQVGLHTCAENQPTNDGRDWYGDHILDETVAENLRVQSLGEFTMILTRGGLVVVETALRCEAPQWFVDRADAPAVKGADGE